MRYKILVVDDEFELRCLLTEILEQAGFEVVLAGNCRQAEKMCRESRPDAVILDVMLPDGDGFSLFGKLREIREIPVLILSARDEDAARLQGLGLGADDYITKPFLPQELCLRLSGVLRRVYGEKNREETVRLGKTTIHWGTGMVENSRGSFTLTAKEYALLKKLWLNRGNIVTIDSLCSALWDGVLIGYENTLMVHVRRLREKIEEDPSHPQYLITVRGLGYRLIKEKTVE